MQATATVKRVLSNEVWLAASAAIAIGLLAIGVAFAATTRDNRESMDTQLPSITEPMTSDNYRFVERNLLPEAAPADAMSFAEMQFLALNTQLPAMPSRPLSAAEVTFIEENTFLGVSSSLALPYTDWLGGPR